MSLPSSFTDKTPRHELPFLFAGQAQREFFLNESLSRLDLLIHPSVTAETGEPPLDPIDGQCFLIGETAIGDWSGREGQIAGWIGGDWSYALPCEGMQIRDQSSATSLTYNGGWQRSDPVAEPSGGSVIDVEARAAIASLIATMRQHGVF